MSKKNSIRVVSRKGSVKSNINAPVILNERDKLVSLVQAWRQKYEQLLSTSQSYFDELEKLKAELKDLKATKELEAIGLREKMLKDRKELEAKIFQLQTIADTAKTEADLVSQNLQRKITLLESETQPLINGFKLREEKLNQKLNERDQQVEFMKNEIHVLHDKLTLSSENYEAEILKLESENERLKTSYLKKMTAVRMHCVRRIAQARQNSNLSKEKPNADETTKGTIENAQKEKNNRITLLKASYNMERKELLGQLEKVKQNAEEEKRKIVHEMNKQAGALKKRVELGRLRIHNRDRIKQELHSYIHDINWKLHQVRQTNMDDVIRRRQSSTLAELSSHLSVLLREFGAIQRAIRMAEGKQNNNPGDVKWTFESLRLELIHASKVAEINRTKQMIRLKQLNLAYQPFYAGKPIRHTEPYRNFNSSRDSSIYFLKNGYTTPESYRRSHDSMRSSLDSSDNYDGKERNDVSFQNDDSAVSPNAEVTTSFNGSQEARESDDTSPVRAPEEYMEREDDDDLNKVYMNTSRPTRLAIVREEVDEIISETSNKQGFKIQTAIQRHNTIANMTETKSTIIKLRPVASSGNLQLPAMPTVHDSSTIFIDKGKDILDHNLKKVYSAPDNIFKSNSKGKLPQIGTRAKTK